MNKLLYFMCNFYNIERIERCFPYISNLLIFACSPWSNASGHLSVAVEGA